MQDSNTQHKAVTTRRTHHTDTQQKIKLYATNLTPVQRRPKRPGTINFLFIYGSHYCQSHTSCCSQAQLPYCPGIVIAPTLDHSPPGYTPHHFSSARPQADVKHPHIVLVGRLWWFGVTAVALQHQGWHCLPQVVLSRECKFSTVVTTGLVGTAKE